MGTGGGVAGGWIVFGSNLSGATPCVGGGGSTLTGSGLG
jgi:hypothetical protein